MQFVGMLARRVVEGISTAGAPVNNCTGKTEANSMILVVDNETFCAQTTKRIAVQGGYACAVASSAVEAMRLLMFRDPGLVLADADLDGDERGIDLLLWMQSAGIQVPAALMTKGDEERVRYSLDRAGLDEVEVLTKPIRLADLRDVIDLCVPQPHARQLAGPKDNRWPFLARRTDRSGH